MATVTYQIGTFAQHHLFSGLWITIATVALTLAIGALKRIGKNATGRQLIPVTQV